MGGGPQRVKETDEERAQTEMAVDSWNMFLEEGIPARNEYMARATGLRPGEDGRLKIDPNGPLNADGTIRTDVSDARTANASALSGAMERIDPNRMNMATTARDSVAGDAASAEIGMGIGQQEAVLQGEQNVARMGQGEKLQAINSQSQLAQQAQGTAINAAQQAENRSASNSYLAGQVVGAGAGLYAHKKGYLDSKVEQQQ